MFREQLTELKTKYTKTVLGFGMPPEGVSLESKLKDEALSQVQITGIMINVGKDLAKIHSRSGIGFGWIDPGNALITRRFVGQYNTWYEFLLAFYDKQTVTLDKIFDLEKESGKYYTQMSKENREQLVYLHAQRPLVRDIFENKKLLLSNATPQILHGNVYIGSIFVNSDGEYAG